jgi:hypothetical protein
MSEILRLAEDFHKCADFVLVYIAEAHAADEWPAGDPFVYTQTHTKTERLKVARDFQQIMGLAQSPIRMVVDDPEGIGTLPGNAFDTLYAPWPTRFYAVEHGLLQFKASPDVKHDYKLEDLRQWVSQRFPEHASSL